MKVVRGKNDLWTTKPQVAGLLANKEDGYKLAIESHKYAEFCCPNCGNVFSRIVRSITRYGFKCPYCSDGVSYPEKFISNLLRELNIKFYRDISTEWSDRRRYDFYIESLSLIIETHGMQHYEERRGFHKGNKRNEFKNDINKRALAKKNGIRNYIEIDCRYSDYEYIKKSILNSKLSKIFDLSNINWEHIGQMSFNSDLITACELYKNGTTRVLDICKMLNLGRDTILNYLHKGNELGLIDYKFHKRPIICVETKKVYDGLKEISDLGFNMSQVSQCCNGKSKTAGGYHWCFADEYNPNTYIMEYPKNTNTPKKVLCIETNVIYNSIEETKKDGFSRTCVSNVCRGKRKTHKNLHFKFVS